VQIRGLVFAAAITLALEGTSAAPLALEELGESESDADKSATSSRILTEPPRNPPWRRVAEAFRFPAGWTALVVTS
jgi:hypothetical protein